MLPGSPKALISAENQALISGLKSVPKGTSLPGGRAAEKELSRQWQEDRLRERLDAAEEELCWREQQARTVWEMQMRAFCEGGSTDGLEEESRRIRELLESARQKYTESAADFDEWISAGEFPESRED